MTVTPDRLRQLAEAAPTFAPHFKAAAGEIDRLASENERLRKLLSKIQEAALEAIAVNGILTPAEAVVRIEKAAARELEGQSDG